MHIGRNSLGKTGLKTNKFTPYKERLKAQMSIKVKPISPILEKHWPIRPVARRDRPIIHKSKKHIVIQPLLRKSHPNNCIHGQRWIRHWCDNSRCHREKRVWSCVRQSGTLVRGSVSWPHTILGVCLNVTLITMTVNEIVKFRHVITDIRLDAEENSFV